MSCKNRPAKYFLSVASLSGHCRNEPIKYRLIKIPVAKSVAIARTMGRAGVRAAGAEQSRHGAIHGPAAISGPGSRIRLVERPSGSDRPGLKVLRARRPGRLADRRRASNYPSFLPNYHSLIITIPLLGKLPPTTKNRVIGGRKVFQKLISLNIWIKFKPGNTVIIFDNLSQVWRQL